MERTKEQLVKEMEIQAWLGELDQLSQSVAMGSVEAFDGLRKAIAPDLEEEGSPRFDIEDLAGFVPPRTLATIYASQKLLNELWDNFGPYSPGFSPDSLPIVHKIVRTVGLFIQAGAFNPNGDKGDPLSILGQGIKAYQQLIQGTEAKERVKTTERWINL